MNKDYGKARHGARSGHNQLSNDHLRSQRKTDRGKPKKQCTQYFPKSGWVKHDAEEIWKSQLGTMQEVLAEAEISHSDLATIGITNQRETVVVWDRATGKPICDAIVWQDRRTAEQCQEMKGDEAEVTASAGLRIDPYFSATKVAWILDSVFGAR